MGLEQFLAAIAAGGQQATDALTQATPELLAQALGHYSAEVERLGAAELTEDNVTALETAVAARGQVAGQQALRSRREAAMGVDNHQPGSDAEGQVTDQAHDTAGQGEGQHRDPRPGRGVERVDAQNGDGGTPPADGQETQTTGAPTGPGGAPASSSSSASDTSGTERQRGGIARFRADAQTAPLERVAAGTVVRTARTTMSGANFEHGQVLDSDQALTDAFAERIWATCGPAGRYPEGERAGVMRVTSEYPEARRLSDRSAEVNDALVAAAIGDPNDRVPEALTASTPVATGGVTGGLCAPLDVQRDITVLGVTNTPIEDSLTGFSVPHGGIQYRAPMDMLAMDTGFGIWTMADDAAVQPLPNPNADIPEPFKSCFVAECPGTIEAILFSTYLCMEFPNILAKFDPEWVRAVTRGSLISHARWTENLLYARMAAASKIVVGKKQLSAVRDILATFDKAASRYRNRYRLSEDVTLHWWLPQWVIDLVRTDMLRGMVTTGASDVAWTVSRQWLEGVLRSRNVNVTWMLDGLDAVTKNGVTIPDQHYGNVSEAAGQVIAPWPTAIDSVLSVEGDWLLLDGGSMDFGVIRDSALNARNRYRTFTERFLGVAFTGMESWRLVMPVEATGAMVGTVPPSQIDDTAGTVAAAMAGLS